MCKFLGKSLAIFVVYLVCSTAFSAPFDMLFRIVKITGDCSVKPADSSEYVPAEEGKAYTYGTAVRTGRKSTAVILLSDGNECRVLSKADFVMAENPDDPKIKTLKLQEGKIEVALDPARHETGNDLNVETATAVCGAVGSLFTVEVRIEGGINVLLVFCSEGELSLHGMNFGIAKVFANTGLSISGDDRNNFSRIKCLKGSFTISYKDSEGVQKEVTIEVNGVAKIWRRQSDAGNVIIVTIILTDPDGTTHPAEVFTEQLGEGEVSTLEPLPADGTLELGQDGVIIIRIIPSATGGGSTTVIVIEESVTPVGKGRS